MSNIYSQKINESDEIDLIELIKNLWKKKLWIILSAFRLYRHCGRLCFYS